MGLIPTTYFDGVVALCYQNNKEEIKGLASGFLYSYHLPEEDNPRVYRDFLVTNRHVFEKVSKKLNSILVRFNPQESNNSAKSFDLQLLNKNKKPLWFAHPDSRIDIAVVPANSDQLGKESIRNFFFRSNTCVADIEKLNDLGTMEGDFVYVLGFPMDLIGENRNTVIARSGTIARIRDALSKNNNEFLIDAFVFPGNSGGPVISKPESIAIEHTKSQSASYLIGIVKSYIPYREVAISQQTNLPRVIFEENSGLAAVHPMNYVNETIAYALEQEKKLV